MVTARRGATSVTGDIVGELSYSTYDDLIQAGLCGAWAPNKTTGAQSFSAASGSFTRSAGSFITDTFAIGDTIIASGFPTAGNNGRFKITALSATVLTVTALDGQTMGTDPATAGCVISSQAATLVTGATRSSFSILKRNLDIGVDTIYTGCEVDKVKFTFPLQEKITATFSMIGSAEQAYTVPGGATFGTANTNDYMTTFQGSLSVAGAANNHATQMDLTLNNQLAAKYSLFNRAAYAMKIGMIEMAGQLSAYVEDDATKALYRNETDTPIVATAVDATVNPNTYTFTLPRARLTSATDQVNGDDLIIQQYNIDAILDSTSGTEFKITRAPKN